MNVQLTEQFQTGNLVVPSAVTVAGLVQPQCFQTAGEEQGNVNSRVVTASCAVHTSPRPHHTPADTTWQLEAKLNSSGDFRAVSIKQREDNT